MAVKDVSTRWLRALKALKKEDQIFGHSIEFNLGSIKCDRDAIEMRVNSGNRIFQLDFDIHQ